MKTNKTQLRKYNLLFVLIISIAFLNPIITKGANRTASASGNWNSTSTWGNNSVPTSGDAVTIGDGITVTITAPAVCASLTFSQANNNISLIISESNTLTVGASGTGAITFTRPNNYNRTTKIDVGAGTLTCGSISLVASSGTRVCLLNISTGTVNVSGNITSGGVASKITITGNGVINVGGLFMSGVKGTFTPGTGTVNFNKNGTQTIGASSCTYIFYNLTLSGTSAKTFPTPSTTVNGTLLLEGTATASTANTAYLTLGPNATLKYNRTGSSTASGFEWFSPFTSSGGIIISGTKSTTISTAKVLSSGIPLTIESGATLATVGGVDLTFGGNFINNGTLSAGNSAIIINGTATQSIGEISTGGNISMTKTSGMATLTGNISGNIFNVDGVGGTIHLGTGLSHQFINWDLVNGTVNGGSSSLSFSGDLTKTNGVYTPNYGTIEWSSGSTPDISNLNYYSLTLSNASGYIASKNFTVNGILNLNANNPASGNVGVLDMGSYTLFLGADATVIGLGDVSGAIERNNLVPDITYAFSNPYTNITIESGGTMPSSVVVKTTIGSAPTGKSDAINRYYEIYQTGGSGSYFSFSFHYLDAELNGNVEQTLVSWDYDIINGIGVNHDEHGRSSYSFTNKWIGLSTIPLTYLTGIQIFTLANTSVPTYTWLGTASPDATEWHDPHNWWPNGNPSEFSIVIIPTNAPILPALQDTIKVKNFIIESGQTFDGSGCDITITGSAGAWDDPDGGFIAGNKKVIFVNTNATINGATTFNDIEIGNGASAIVQADAHIKIGNSISLTGTGVFNATLFHNTIEYIGVGQNVIIPNGNTPGYHNLILSGDQNLPATQLDIYGDFTISNSSTNSALSTINTRGNLTIEAGSTFNTNNNSLTIGGDFVNMGNLNNISSPITFAYSTLTQNIDPFSTSGVVSMTKPLGTVNLLGDITVGGLTLNGAGGALNLGSYSHAINGDVSLASGTLKGGTSTINMNSSSLNTWNGTGSNFDPETSTVNFDAAGNQTINATNARFYHLNLSNSGTKTISSSTQVSGNFNTYCNAQTQASLSVIGNMTIDISGNFTAGAFNHSIGGNFQNSGTFTANSGSTLTMNGTLSEQSIASSNPLSLYNLTMNNTYYIGRLTLSTPISISNTLTLTNNNIFTTSTNIITMGTTSSVSPEGGSASSFIDGPIEKTGTSGFVFPVGNNTRWARIEIGAPSSSSTFKAQYFDSPYSNTNSYLDLYGVSQSEYWDLHRSSGSGSTSVKIFWEDSARSGISNCSDLRIAHWNGSAWENVTDNVGYSGCNPSPRGHIYSNTTVSSFSPFAFGTKTAGGNLLISNLISFEANCENNNTHISWQTSSEINSEYFEIEKSKDDKNWIRIGREEAAGNSNELLNYTYLDLNTNQSSSFYRLKMIDFDGKFKYSKTITSVCSNSQTEILKLYPNPAQSETTIEVNEEVVGSTFEIINVYNQSVQKGIVDNTTTHINLQNLPSGIYLILILTKNNRILQERLVVD